MMTGENCVQCRFVHHVSHTRTDTGSNPDFRRERAATNRLNGRETCLNTLLEPRSKHNLGYKNQSVNALLRNNRCLF